MRLNNVPIIVVTCCLCLNQVKKNKEMGNIFKDYTFKEIRAIAQYFSNQEHIKPANLNPTIDSLKHSIQDDKNGF